MMRQFTTEAAVPLSAESQSQDESPTKSPQAHDRAQNPRTPSPRHPRAAPVEVPLHAASRGENHAVSGALADFGQHHNIRYPPAFPRSSAPNLCPQFAKSPSKRHSPPRSRLLFVKMRSQDEKPQVRAQFVARREA